MNRNVLYIVIAALAVVAGVVGYQLYQERQKYSGIEIDLYLSSTDWLRLHHVGLKRVLL